MQKKTRPAILAMTFLMIISLSSCGDSVPRNSVFSPEDLPGKNVAVAQNAVASALVTEFTNGGAAISVYPNLDDAVTALRAGLADCVVADSSSKISKRGVKILDEPMMSRDFAFMAALENSDLVSDINSALAALRDNGVLSSIIDGWLSGSGSDYKPKEEEFSAYITLGVRTDFPPYAFIDENGGIAGMDVDIARAVCDYIGVGLNVLDIPADSLMSSVQSGRIDMAMSGSSPSGESEGKVRFSEPYTTCTQVIIVRKK